MRPVNVWLPEPDIEKLDTLIKRGMYPSRNEAIRLAVKDLIKEEASS